MSKICEYLEKAFSEMNILHKKTGNDDKIFYQLNFPETSIFCSTTDLIIDKMFVAEIRACAAKGISPKMRETILEKINEIHEEFRLIRISIDKNNDVCSRQYFVLVGDEAMMCKQIVMNLLIFYDLHKRTAQQILNELGK